MKHILSSKHFQVTFLTTFIFIIIVSSLYIYIKQSYSVKILYSNTDHYGKHIVYEKSNLRCLTFDENLYINQSCIYVNDVDHVVFNYTKLALGSLYFYKKPPKRVLVIGLGGGVLPKLLLQLLPEVHLDIIEINKNIQYVSKEYFGFVPTENTNIFIEDGFQYISRLEGKKYDLIIIDVCSEIGGVSSSFLEIEFIEKVKNSLNNNGLIVLNSIKNSSYSELETELYHKIFGSFLDINLQYNRLIFALKANELPTFKEISNNSTKWEEKFKRFDISSKKILSTFKSNCKSFDQQ